MNISELLEQLELGDDLIQTTCTTVGGWATDVIEHIPEAGETAETGIFKITVLTVNEQTVEKILLEIDRPDENEDEKSTEEEKEYQ